MLIKCPECELQASDKAAACPHCGYPLQPNAEPRKPRKSNKRRRLPNGFGQISEIKNRNLRNPFRAMVTVGKTETGRPICKPLKPESYFHTYNEAYAALVEYNKNPYDLDSEITMKELYEKWSEEYFKTLKSETSIRATSSTWSYCSSVYDMRVVDIRVRHIKGCMDEGTIVVNGKTRHPSVNTKVKIKSMFNMMLDYAVEYEIVDKNYARTFNLPVEVKQKVSKKSTIHAAFTDEEMEKLWNSVDEIPYVDVVLIQCYSGCRPQELGLIKLENINFEDWTFKGGMKTDAGIDRIVPIHSKIRYLVERKYKEALSLKSKYLINVIDIYNNRGDRFLSYSKYQKRFTRTMNLLQLNPEHKPHDPRVQFVTMAKKYNLDEYAIKYIIGHSIQDITEKVYTRREIEWLKTEIEKIK